MTWWGGGNKKKFQSFISFRMLKPVLAISVLTLMLSLPIPTAQTHSASAEESSQLFDLDQGMNLYLFIIMN